MTHSDLFSGFSDGKDPKALRTIGEVTRALGIKQHVLRYWEEQFPTLAPIKRSGGRRYYRPEDVATIVEIDRLVHREGYTLRGARAAIEAREQPLPPLVAAEPVAADPAAATALNGQLRAIRDELKRALAAA